MAKKKEVTFDSLMSEYENYISKKVLDRPYYPIPTGIISLDVSTGIGGIPRYRWSNIWGPKASGKTTLALNIARNALLSSEDSKILYIDIESGLDWNYIQTTVGDDILKFDDSGGCINFILIQPETSEQAFQFAEKGIDSDEFELIIFDSIGALAPQKEKDDDFEDANVALVARQLGKFLRRNASKLKHSTSTAFLFINQVRASIGSYFSTFSQPGGFQLEHHISMEIRLGNAKKIKEGSDVVGQSSRFDISKNKCSPPWKTFELYITYGKGIDPEKDAMEFGKLLGVVKRRGPSYYINGEQIATGMNNAIQELEEHPELFDTIKEMCYNSLNIKKDEVKEGTEDETED